MLSLPPGQSGGSAADDADRAASFTSRRRRVPTAGRPFRRAMLRLWSTGPNRGLATGQWMLGHLPLTAAIAAMGAAMVSLIDHAHDSRTPAATAWVLSAGAAVVVAATMLVAATLQDWRRDRSLYRPLARICAAVAVACLAVGAARPPPLFLGVALVVLLSVPWVFAVAHRLARDTDTPIG